MNGKLTQQDMEAIVARMNALTPSERARCVAQLDKEIQANNERRERITQNYIKTVGAKYPGQTVLVRVLL